MALLLADHQQRLAFKTFACGSDLTDWELSATFRAHAEGTYVLQVIGAARISDGFESLHCSGDGAWVRLCGFYTCAPTVTIELWGPADSVHDDEVCLAADVLPQTLRAGLSLLIRARNEQEHLASVLASVADLVDEIVYVDNGSTDQSLAIATAFARRSAVRMVVTTYPLPVPRVGDAQRDAVRRATFGASNTRSPATYLGADVAPFGNTLGQFYNFVLRRASCANVMKWDADCVAQRAALAKMIEQHRLRMRRDAFALWCTGETVFADPDRDLYWRKDVSWYDEYRVYSKAAGFRYRDNSCWEGPSWRYYDACAKERFEEAVFREVRPLRTVLARPVVDMRDQVDHTTCAELAKYGNSEHALATESPYSRAADVKAPLGRLLYVTPHLGCGGVETMLGVHVRILSRTFDVDVLPTRGTTVSSHAIDATILDVTIAPEKLVARDYDVIVWNAVYLPNLAPSLSKARFMFITHSDVAYFNAETMRYVRSGDTVVTINEATRRKWTGAFDPQLAAGTFCEQDAQRYATLYKDVRVVCAPNALPLTHKTGSQPQNTTFLFVGRLDHPKRVDVLLRALQRMPPSTRLDIVGEGPLRERLELLRDDLRLADRVAFCGAWPNDAVRQVLASGRYAALVLLSAHEGVPVVLLEAMVAGVPVVASHVGGVGEVVRDGETGFAIRLEPLEELAQRTLAVEHYAAFDAVMTEHMDVVVDKTTEALHRVLRLTTNDRDRLCIAARQQVAEHYTQLKSSLLAACLA